MAIINDFDYAKPKTLNEAFRLFSDFKNPLILAGGTDVVEMIKEGTISPDIVVDIKGLFELRDIFFDGKKLFIGSTVTFSEIIESEIIKEYVPVFIEMAKTVASVGIRNRATIVGNICSAVPCMDSGPLLLAYDSNVIVISKDGERKIPITDWFIGPRKTALMKNEIVKGVEIDLPVEKHSGCWLKLGRYQGEDLAQVNLVVLAFADKSFRISYGAVAPVPVRASEIEKLLDKADINSDIIYKAMELVETEISPISDIRASKEYRMLMSKVMLKRALEASILRLENKGPEYGTSLI